MTQQERSNSLRNVGKRISSGFGILTITSSVLVGHYFPSNFENDTQLRLSKALKGHADSSRSMETNIQEPAGGLLGYRISDLNIGFPVGVSFVDGESYVGNNFEEEIVKFVVLELSKVFEVPLSDFENEFEVDIDCLKLTGTEGQANIPFVIVSPLKGGESFSFILMDLSEDYKLQVPNGDHVVSAGSNVLIPLDRVISPYNNVNTLDAVGDGGVRQTLIRYIEGHGWVFISPFPDFVAAQDLLIDYDSLKEACVLFDCGIL